MGPAARVTRQARVRVTRMAAMARVRRADAAVLFGGRLEAWRTAQRTIRKSPTIGIFRMNISQMNCPRIHATSDRTTGTSGRDGGGCR